VVVSASFLSDLWRVQASRLLYFFLVCLISLIREAQPYLSSRAVFYNSVIRGMVTRSGTIRKSYSVSRCQQWVNHMLLVLVTVYTLNAFFLYGSLVLSSSSDTEFVHLKFGFRSSHDHISPLRLPRLISPQMDIEDPWRHLYHDMLKYTVSAYENRLNTFINESLITEYWRKYNKLPSPIHTRPKKYVHFIFLTTLCSNGLIFKFMDYLVLRSVFLRGNPDAIFLHVNTEPRDTPLWRLIKPMVTSLIYERHITHIFGNKISGLSHLSDVYRMMALIYKGGIYMDIDTILLEPLDIFVAAPSGLCMGWEIKELNQLASNFIASTPNNTFLHRWLDQYKTFDDNLWVAHAGPTAGMLAREFPNEVDALNEESCARPIWNKKGMKQLFDIQNERHSKLYNFHGAMSVHYWGRIANHQMNVIQRASAFSIYMENNAINQALRPLLPNPYFSFPLACTVPNLKELIGSILKQSFPLFEIVVSGKCDKKLSSDSRIKYGEETLGIWEVSAFEPVQPNLLEVIIIDISTNTNEFSFEYKQAHVIFLYKSEEVIWNNFNKGPHIHSSRIEPQAPFTLDATTDCSFDLLGNKPIIDEIKVLAPRRKLPSILCYVLCNSDFHEKIAVIKETWGSQCDKFIAFSDMDDASIGAVAISMKTDHSWGNLWDKNRESIRYLYDNNIAQKYDWIFKADADVYVIVNNLKSHLTNRNMSNPQLVGCKFTFPLRARKQFSLLPRVNDYYKKQHLKDQWMYASGAGYAMNKNFIRKMRSLLDTPRCNPNFPALSEDFGVASCVASTYILSPASSRDEFGREMFHHFPPKKVTELKMKYEPKDGLYWWNEVHQEPYNPVPPIGNESFSRKSVLFHGLDATMLLYMHNQFHKCRAR
jgi:Fringe-like/Glycosyltransferase sugar-binding region containing DXD motif